MRSAIWQDRESFSCGTFAPAALPPMTPANDTGRLILMRPSSPSHPAQSAKAGSDPTPVAASRTYVVAGTAVSAPRPAAGLHLVATPIGNLGDVSLRALETLAGCDLIACEDTRVTRKLLDRYGIATPLAPYHDHNAEEARPQLMARLMRGAALALVSDAGTPLISDPGYKLVRAAHEAGHAVHAVPGASAVLAALSLAGLPTDRFYFEGFLPAKEQARRARARDLARIDATLVVFESGSRLARALADLAAGLGDRAVAICRELTKLHEEVRRGRLADLAAQADTLETRGEFVLVIGPPAAPQASAEDVDALLRAALARASLKDAVADVVDATGQPKRAVYARALELVRENDASGERGDA